MKTVQFGIDCLIAQKNTFQNLRIALVTNNAATTSTGEASRIALLKAGFTITKLFSPEHGLTAQGEDGAYQNNSIDLLTQLPVTSLYGDYLMPTAEDLADVDTVLFDIPDVGCRFYTYLWTMTYVMEACSKYNKPLIILDRPNPISADIEKAEGPMLNEKNCSAFIGRWSIPVRHSCTLGELATYFADTRIKNLTLDIIKVQNWNRKQTAQESCWHFVPTSPAIKDVETALLYPGMGLLEGINVNEGRGTNLSFKVMGAPWIDSQQLSNAFKDLQLPGVATSTINYTPAWGVYANEKCNGLQFSITDSRTFQPVKTGLELLKIIALLYPYYITERLYPTVANPSGSHHLDKLTGVFNSFKKILNKEIITTQVNDNWQKTIQPFLLY